MSKVSVATRERLGWTLAGISAFHAVVLLWGAATWSQRLEDDLKAVYGGLIAPYVEDSLTVRGAPTEFLMAVLAALACIGWILVARDGRAPRFLRDWKGSPALLGGGAVTLVYLAATVVPLLIIVNPRDYERIPSWDALGVFGDITFLVVFLIDAIALARWTLERSQQSARRY